MGIPFYESIDRGLYKSTDGGLTWTKKLFVSENAGVIDMVMNPTNPQVIYAASWNRIRNTMEEPSPRSGASALPQPFCAIPAAPWSPPTTAPTSLWKRPSIPIAGASTAVLIVTPVPLTSI